VSSVLFPFPNSSSHFSKHTKYFFYFLPLQTTENLTHPPSAFGHLLFSLISFSPLSSSSWLMLPVPISHLLSFLPLPTTSPHHRNLLHFFFLSFSPLSSCSQSQALLPLIFSLSPSHRLAHSRILLHSKMGFKLLKKSPSFRDGAERESNFFLKKKIINGLNGSCQVTRERSRVESCNLELRPVN
jgi:hypothetical protein